jgi:hypothetical protein
MEYTSFPQAFFAMLHISLAMMSTYCTYKSHHKYHTEQSEMIPLQLVKHLPYQNMFEIKVIDVNGIYILMPRINFFYDEKIDKV